MRIVLLNQFFWPDTVATSQMLTDVARGLAKEHEVTAICGSAEAVSTGSEDSSRPDVRILRIRTAGFGHSAPARAASYLTYLGGVLWSGGVLRRPDCFVALTTPPILSAIGLVFARLRGARLVIWEMDVYPDIATGIGYFRKGGIPERLTGAVLDWARKGADGVIALGEDMKARLVARGIPEGKIHVAENWASGHEIVPMAFPEGPLTVHYSGNLGLAHEVQTICRVLDRLANDRKFRFIFAGGGPRRPHLEAYCRERSIGNVEFRPYCANAKLGHSLAEGHLGLVTQIPETLGSIVPSKVYGIMAAGRPLLYIGPEGSTPASHISGFDCGWRIEPGNVEGLVGLLHHLEANRHLLHEAGSRGRLAFERYFDRPIGVARIACIVLDSNPMRTRA